jgi:hypothetical protein
LFVREVDLVAFWILRPKINEHVPIKNETTVRRFCTTEVMMIAFCAAYADLTIKLFVVIIISNMIRKEFTAKIISQIYCL